MPNAQLKDYYKILELQPAATNEQVKKAYRIQAFKYHPDTNPDNQYAAAHFLEIQEAYSVLIDETRRRRYDEERWLSGMSNRAKDQVVITPEWIHKEACRLSRHMATVDTYRMSHSALYDYVFLLLQDSYMAILQQTNDVDTNALIVKELLQSTRHLKYMYMQSVGNKLAELVHDDEALTLIHRQVQRSRKQYLWQKYQPYVIAIITIALCVLMYFYNK